MKFGVVVFPGSNCDHDTYHALSHGMDQETRLLWHAETDLQGADAIIIPGGFSYGDYLRCGAIARFSPVMEAVENFAGAGGMVFGICNGFQILCESGLLPGILLRNNHLQFRCQWTDLRIERADTAFTNAAIEGEVIRVPISHGEGNFYADDQTLKSIEGNGQVLFRYSSSNGDITASSNPNGSVNNIAGITNLDGNVLGMMPHPERCCDLLLGGEDGQKIFRSILNSKMQNRS